MTDVNSTDAKSTKWAEGLHISLSGLIGAGKSTLAKQLSEGLGLPLFEEKVAGNDCLEAFYKDEERNAFLLQISLLAQRLDVQHVLAWNKTGGVQDRSIYEDRVFCRVLHKRGKMTDLELKTYRSLWNTICRQLPQPDVILHLRVPPKECLNRIKERSRGIESGIDLDYLVDLNEAYDEYLEEISKKMFVITIDWSDYRGVDDVIATLKRVWENASRVHHVIVKP